MKSHIPKQQAKIIKYRNYKGFNETKFRSELTNILDLNIHESRNIEFFKNIFLKVLNKNAPIKTKYLRANRSHLRKAKSYYYENLDLGKVNDSKKFWNTVQPLF